TDVRGNDRERRFLNEAAPPDRDPECSDYHSVVRTRGRTSISEPTAFVLSVLLHLGVALLLLRAATADGRDRSLEHELEDEREPAPEQEPLGIEQSEAETLTWIGYEEYQEHLARLSEVEQAAMLASPVSGGGGTPPPSRPPTARPTPAAPP
ncbi:MAG TPA: hypothetical protein DCG14_04665, partial [Phycisphaerales bacterium]|nr:hypothetical protein [Phycisphaerales bacterium]